MKDFILLLRQHLRDNRGEESTYPRSVRIVGKIITWAILAIVVVSLLVGAVFVNQYFTGWKKFDRDPRFSISFPNKPKKIGEIDADFYEKEIVHQGQLVALPGNLPDNLQPDKNDGHVPNWKSYTTTGSDLVFYKVEVLQYPESYPNINQAFSESVQRELAHPTERQSSGRYRNAYPEIDASNSFLAAQGPQGTVHMFVRAILVGNVQYLLTVQVNPPADYDQLKLQEDPVGSFFDSFHLK